MHVKRLLAIMPITHKSATPVLLELNGLDEFRSLALLQSKN